MTYRGSDKKLRAIAGELGVATVLEGGVQRAGNQVRINVQLIDAATDAHLWAETYTRALTIENVFAIQSEIASAIASALKAVLTPEEKRQLEELPTQNLAALEAFFKAKSNDGSAAQTAEAISHLRRAVSLDPDFAEAHALLADQILRQVWTDGLRPADQVAKAQPHVERALALAPKSSNAYAALGHLRNRQRRTDDAVAALRHAIELNANNAAAYALLGYVQLWSRRDSGAAVESYRKALELDPLSPLTRQQTAEALSVDGRFDEAKAELEQLLQAAPGYVEGVRNYGELQEYAYYRFDEAIKAYRRVVALDPRNPNFVTKLAMAHYHLGDTVAAKFWIERALAVSSQSREAGFLKGVLSLIEGDDDAAIAQFRTVSGDATFYGNARQILFKAALDDGRPETAAAELATLPPESVPITQGNIRIECIRMCLLTVAGRRTEADELGERILAAMPQLARIGMRGYYADDVLVHLARNDRDRALVALQELSNAGACSAKFGMGAPFRVLQENPAFQALMKINATRLAEQRSNVERWEAAGELAPIPPLPDNLR
jgi:tetratricopeptide (TPR) repeat protein